MKPDDYVLIKRPPIPGPLRTAGLMAEWIGPFKILSRKDDNYFLQDMRPLNTRGRNEFISSNIVSLREFYKRQEKTLPKIRFINVYKNKKQIPSRIEREGTVETESEPEEETFEEKDSF